MANRLVTAALPSRKKKQQKKGDVEGIVVDVVDNGFVAYCRHENSQMGYEEPEKKIFTDLDSLLGYIRESLAGAVKAEAGEMNDQGY